MVSASSVWIDVEVKLAELKRIVNECWDAGDWLGAMSGESLIRTVEKSITNSAELRNQTNKLLSSLKEAEAYNCNNNR